MKYEVRYYDDSISRYVEEGWTLLRLAKKRCLELTQQGLEAGVWRVDERKIRICLNVNGRPKRKARSRA